MGVAVAAGILVLTGCSNGSETSRSTTTTADPIPASTSSAASVATSGTTAEGSAVDTVPSTTAFTSVSESTTRKPAATPSAPKPSGTATVGPLDDDSVRWFTALCTGLSSADTSKARQETGDLAARQAGAADVFDGAAEAYRTMRDDLSDIGAPAIPNGEALQDTLLKAAPAMAEAAEQGAADIKAATDENGVSKAVDQADDAVSEARAPLSDFAEAMAAPALAAQLEGIDACRPLFT